MQAVSIGKAPQISEYLFEQIGSSFPRWCAAFSRFEESRRHLPAREQNGLKVIKIHQLHMMMYYEYARSSERAMHMNETSLFSWDDYKDQFAEIVSLAASVVNTYGAQSPLSEQFDSAVKSNQIQPFFCLDDGVLAPLYEVATLCRDPTIRRRAVNILREAPRQEGLFNSHLLAMVAEKAITIEEEAAASGAGGVMNYDSIITDTRVEKHEAGNTTTASMVTNSSQVPDSVRLVYAFPKFDLVERKISLTIGPSTKKEIDIPWPALNFLVDVGR